METESNFNFENQVLAKLVLIEGHLLVLLGKEDKMNEQGLLDNQDLCILLKVSKRTLQRYRRSGKLRYHRIGQKTFYIEADVKEFIRLHIKKDDN